MSSGRITAIAATVAARDGGFNRLLQHVGLGVSIRAASSYAWGVGFWDPRVTGRGLTKARTLGLATTVYTVNEPERMRELSALGVDGIFTDCPDRARAAMRPR